MKKGFIIILIIGIIISAFGVGLIAIAVSNKSFKRETVDVKNTIEINDDFSNIDIDIMSADIEFIINSDNKCVIDVLETQKQHHKANVENDKLVIRSVDERRWYEKIFSFNFEAMKLKISLPKNTYNNLIIKNSSGNLKLSDFTFNETDIKTSSGNIDISNLNSSKTNITTSSGNIIIKDSKTNDTKLQVSSGNIDISNTNSLNSTITTSSGNINLIDYIIENNLDARVSSGNIIFSKIDAKDINMKTSSGDIKGSVLTPKTFIANTSSGDINVDKTSTGDRCVLNTSSGNINVTVINK